MPSAWIFQDDKQVKKHGAKAASWYVGWVDPAGKRRCKSCGSGSRGKSLADKLRKSREAELITGTYEDKGRKEWVDFRTEYDANVLNGMDVRNRQETTMAISQFERIVNPKRMAGITSLAIADYVAQRRRDQGMKPGSKLSPATVNKELRHIRAVLRKAKKWHYLAEVPDFDFLREHKKLPTYVPPEDFAKLYQSCEHTKRPNHLAYPTAVWWQAMHPHGLHDRLANRPADGATA